MIVIGIGQSLRSDDAVGLAVVNHWRNTFPESVNRPGILVELVELPGLFLLDLLAGARAAILVDAVHGHSSPGAIHILKETNLAAFHPGSGSAHGWGVAETLALGRRLNPEWLPQNMVLIGIEGQDFSPGLCLSAPVQKALDQAVNIVDEWVKIYLGDKI